MSILHYMQTVLHFRKNLIGKNYFTNALCIHIFEGAAKISHPTVRISLQAYDKLYGGGGWNASWDLSSTQSDNFLWSDLSIFDN